jgi:nucleoside-triphosphatase
MVKNLFITGKPASGKTTLIKETCLPLVGKAGGFYTDEITEGGARLGFILKTFDGRQGVLAKKGMKSAYRLNKYGIDVGVLENIGADSLLKALKTNELIVIDEIGSMEIISELFRKTLLECLNSDKKILATVRYNAQPFTDEIKKLANTSILVLSRENYIGTKKEVKNWLKEL